jgi:hypothetical protein
MREGDPALAGLSAPITSPGQFSPRGLLRIVESIQ